MKYSKSLKRRNNYILREDIKWIDPDKARYHRYYYNNICIHHRHTFNLPVCHKKYFSRVHRWMSFWMCRCENKSVRFCFAVVWTLIAFSRLEPNWLWIRTENLVGYLFRPGERNDCLRIIIRVVAFSKFSFISINFGSNDKTDEVNCPWWRLRRRI